MKDILFLGDFFYDFKKINDDILELSKFIKDNDLLTVLNFEGSFRNSKGKSNKLNSFRCSKTSIEVLKLLNVVAVNLANNHVMDDGEEGLIELIDALDEAGIGHFGAGINKEESQKPFVLDFGNRKVTFYGMGWDVAGCVNATSKKAGTAPLDFDYMQNVLDKRDARHVVILLHLGYHYERLPQPYHFKKIRELARCKRVKAIFGHHSHVVQAFDKYNNIFYGLGNFYLGTKRKLYTKEFEHYPHVNQGIGVILETMYWKTQIIKFFSTGQKTIIKNEMVISNFVDTCKVAINKYPKYFRKHNNNLNKMSVLGISSFHICFLNKIRSSRRKMNGRLSNYIKKLISRRKIKNSDSLNKKNKLK